MTVQNIEENIYYITLYNTLLYFILLISSAVPSCSACNSVSNFFVNLEIEFMIRLQQYCFLL